ncbi:S-adenosyl-L-methionine-dependent methyltransferase [Piedraia hortae CBS 480.64]|uniref:S-adenosyl-L-methionine-dependent methyltransferase n=1 Tax=Piedraia hortae CBS 480.64 TaxID=1314780 RepID=A0A6A7BR67_9PEZI|nr:S-adenosyl-L-methionine-dependent methyltransferase [Piedraia hortae CBS 480.64]
MSSNKSTYAPGYVPSQITHHEWRTVENSAAYLLPTLRALSSKSDTSPLLLDIGCGSGTITRSLASHLPNGKVIGTDISDEILSRAKELCHGTDNVTLKLANVYSLPFEDGKFDVVHASMVLGHLDNPVAAYREMLRVTKPNGGIVANREPDLSICTYYPRSKPMDEFHALQLKVMGEGAVIGPKMVHLAMEAGAKREDITPSFGTWCYASPEERKIWGGAFLERLREGNLGKTALEKGYATKEEIEGMIKAWEKWSESEDGVYGCMLGEILIKKGM